MLHTLQTTEGHWLSLQEIFVSRTYAMMLEGRPDAWAHEWARSRLDDTARHLFFPDRAARASGGCWRAWLGFRRKAPAASGHIPFVALVPDENLLPPVKCIGLFHGPATDETSQAAMLSVAWFQEDGASLLTRQAEALLSRLDWVAHAENFDF